uniref:GDP-fucose protein O-fucosyltransferase 1 n=1 Tax=Heterorhabditis bacteriophora TaxID=37862 RepID=A0A1I7XUW2_HETBA
MVPFEHIFRVSAVSKYLKVVTMAEFTKHMSKLWPKNNRTGSVKTWTERFPPSEYPVLAFSSAPAPFPSRQNSWELQRYLKWNSRITARAKHFINSKITRPFLAVHLRNDMDWGRVCEHISPNGADQPLFASAQCLGEGHYDGKLTKEICSPSKDTIFGDIVTEVGRIGAKSVFIASDKDHMIEDINDALRAYDLIKSVTGDEDDELVDDESISSKETTENDHDVLDELMDREDHPEYESAGDPLMSEDNYDFAVMDVASNGMKRKAC